MEFRSSMMLRAAALRNADQAPVDTDPRLANEEADVIHIKNNGLCIIPPLTVPLPPIPPEPPPDKVLEHPMKA